jgi:superfamily II DNA/RNA helicase
MVFFSSCNAVKFHSELLNYVDVRVSEIHGRQKQQKRTTTFFEFCNAKSGILLCTDVAARGLDIPNVDWIVQYDPPDDPKEYIHRVGRAARGADGNGRALLFLTPDELKFLKYLKKAKVTVSEHEFPAKKVRTLLVVRDLSSHSRICWPGNLYSKCFKEVFETRLREFFCGCSKEVRNSRRFSLDSWWRSLHN